MKTLKIWVTLGLAIAPLAIAISPATSQTGNQSDVTGPTPVPEIPAQPPIAPPGDIQPLPVAEPTAPVVEPTAPVVEPTAPVVEPTEPTLPIAEPTAPIAEPTAPIAEPTLPIAEPTAPIAEPTAPIAEPTAPTVEPVFQTPPVSEPPQALPANPVQENSDRPTPGERNSPPENPGPSRLSESQLIQGERSNNAATRDTLGAIGDREVDRPAYENLLQVSNVSAAIQTMEEFQAVEFGNYLDIDLFGETATPDEIAQTLYDLWQVTGRKTALIYVSALANELEIITIFPHNFRTASARSSELIASSAIAQGLIEKTANVAQRTVVPNVPQEQLFKTVGTFRGELTNPRKLRTQTYLESAQQLYQWLVAPIEAQLQENEIDTLVFSMDSGLRGLPLSALHDGERFLIEKYALALVPSFGLTDVSYSDIRNRPILAMGASVFPDLSPLPAVPIELQTIVGQPWQGEMFLNEGFTSQNFERLNQQHSYGIIHLATHAEFQGGNLNESYINFSGEKVSMTRIRQLAIELGWSTAESPPIELLTLSACRTAVGDREAELGFAGLALLSGVKSALASLWYVSDAGTLGLMTDFYNQLSQTPLKAEALQRSQLAMLKGEVRVENGMLHLSNGETVPLPPELAEIGDLNLSHPYFWSAFMLVGNWN